MGRGRPAGYDEQREMILAERAASCSRGGGYPGTSMNQVAEACGLSKATLYHYYRDKYELLVTSPRRTSTGCRHRRRRGRWAQPPARAHARC